MHSQIYHPLPKPQLLVNLGARKQTVRTSGFFICMRCTRAARLSNLRAQQRGESTIKQSAGNEHGSEKLLPPESG